MWYDEEMIQENSTHFNVEQDNRGAGLPDFCQHVANMLMK